MFIVFIKLKDLLPHMNMTVYIEVHQLLSSYCDNVPAHACYLFMYILIFKSLFSPLVHLTAHYVINKWIFSCETHLILVIIFKTRQWWAQFPHKTNPPLANRSAAYSHTALSKVALATITTFQCWTCFSNGPQRHTECYTHPDTNGIMSACGY